MKRLVLAIIVLVTFSGVILAAFAISDNKNTTNQVIQQQPLETNNVNSNLSSRNYVAVHKIVSGPASQIISPEKAKEISEKYIVQRGAIAGTPELVKEDGRKVYVIPVLINKKTVGEIHLDANTGKNRGGAGGVD